MPTEVTPSPFGYEQQLPMALEHPRFYNCFASSPVPPTGPARLADIVPNTVMPNGVRNPWAPYSGETYRPASKYNGYIQTQHLQPSAEGGPRAGFGGMGARTVIPSYPRVDEGWNGSYGRVHNGHAPDMLSTSGVIGPTSTSTWVNQPSSRQIHVRMTPIAVENNYHAPPVSQSVPSRRYTPRAIPIADACPSCGRGEQSSRAMSSSSNSYQDRLRDCSPAHCLRRHANSPNVESPLRRIAEVPLVRKLSRSPSKRSNDWDHCKECCRE